MDAVNNRQIPTNYSQSTTNVNNNVGVSNAPPAAGPGGGNNVEQGSLSGPGAAGEMAYADASLNGSDWGALLDSVQAANLSVSVTAIMVLLVEIMAQMKQDAREEAFTQAQATLAAGELAAKEMENAAEDTLKAARIQAGMQITKGVLDMGGGLMQYKAAGSYAGDKSSYGTSVEGMQDAAGTAGMKSVGDLASAIGGLFSAEATYDAAMHTAASQEARANAEYQQALGQAAQAFMQQVADAIKAFLNTMQSVDQAQHKATGAIYNC